MVNESGDIDPPGCRDLDYGLDGGIVATRVDTSSEEDEDIASETDIKEKIQSIKEEVEGAMKDINNDINDCKLMSKDEKKTIKRFFSKRLKLLQDKYSEEAKDAAAYTSKLTLDDIDEELDEEISKLRDLVSEMTDDYWPNEFKSYSGFGSTSYGQSKLGSEYDYDDLDHDSKWPKRDYSFSSKRTNCKYEAKDYSKDLKEVKSDKVLRIKLDRDSLVSFLSESDGKKENIAVITSDNREYSDIEKLVFRIALIPDEHKNRYGAFTDADGKKIAEMISSVNTVKCGWIHTHPFGEHSTFFSGTDDTNSKEMCVLPDDYCLAIVVGCSYREVENYMNDGGRVVKEYELRYSLGRVVYRKVEVPENEYDPKTDKIKSTPDLLLAKYDCEVILVDKNGNEAQLPEPAPEKYKNVPLAKEEPSYENQQFMD